MLRGQLPHGMRRMTLDPDAATPVMPNGCERPWTGANVLSTTRWYAPTKRTSSRRG